MNENKNEIYFGGGDNLIMTTSKPVTCHEILTLVTPEGGTIHLDVKIQADFDTIPEKYHEVLLNIMSAKYIKTVSFGDNPFSVCQPKPKRKWYMFWRSK